MHDQAYDFESVYDEWAGVEREKADPRTKIIVFASFEADETQHEATDKSKVFVAVTSGFASRVDIVDIFCIRSDERDEVRDVDIEGLQNTVTRSKSMCDLQGSIGSSGKDTFNAVEDGLKSAGPPTVRGRVEAASACPHPYTYYGMCYGRGAGSQGDCSRLKNFLRGSSNITVWIDCCFMHGGHRIAKNVVAALDGWEWSSGWTLPKYFTCLATCTNVWLSSGTPERLKAVACKAPGGEVSVCVLPGKCLRGRAGVLWR